MPGTGPLLLSAGTSVAAAPHFENSLSHCGAAGVRRYASGALSTESGVAATPRERAPPAFAGSCAWDPLRGAADLPARVLVARGAGKWESGATQARPAWRSAGRRW